MTEEEKAPEMDQTTALYLMIAIIVALLGVIFGDYEKLGRDMGYTPGVIGRIFLFFFLVPGGFYDLKAGRWVRDAIMPDFIMTNSVGGIVKAKLFWAFVPQTVGLFAGMALGGAVFIAPMSWIFG